jgi:cation:H+ antiporter
MTWLQLLGGLVLLAAGAELLVRGAAGLAARSGLSALVIGLTVVAFGTSAPEVAVSLDATLAGRSAIAVGNVVGSNVFNVLFILGASAIVAPLLVSRQILRTDVPILIGVSALAWVMALDGRLSRFDGGLLLVGFVAYTAFTVREGRRQSAAEAPAGRPSSPWAVQAGLVLAGLALLVLGAHWFVAGAVDVARLLAWSETVIGLTIVAAGTSMPEVATSLLAAVRGERDIAVGNVVGSNILNLLAILGLSAVVAAGGLEVAPAVLRFDLPVMVAVALATAPIALIRGVIGRAHGLFFLGAYAAYTGYLVLDSTGHDALPALSAVMLEFVLPIVAVTLIVLLVQGLRRTSRGPDAPHA